MIVETAYPFTSLYNDNYTNQISGSAPYDGYGVSQQEQLRFMKDLTQQVITGGGIGVMYWAPDWVSSPMKDNWGTGSSWENCALFDFQSNALPALDFMNQTYKF